MDEQSSHLVEQALEAMPSGRFLITAAHGGYRSGMMVNWAGRCCENPMLICVSALKGHAIDPLIRDSRSFALGVVEADDKMIQRQFGAKKTWAREQPGHEHDDPFDSMPTRVLTTGSPVLTRCVTWFDCEVLRRIDLESEIELFVGVVVEIWHNGESVKVERG